MVSCSFMSRTWEAILCWACSHVSAGHALLSCHAVSPGQSFAASPAPDATISGIKSRRFGPDAEADTGGGEPASRVGHVESDV